MSKRAVWVLLTLICLTVCCTEKQVKKDKSITSVTFSTASFTSSTTTTSLSGVTTPGTATTLVKSSNNKNTNGSACSIEAAFSKEDPAACDCFSNEQHARDRCYQEAAFFLSNGSLCDQIKDDLQMNVCVGRFGGKTGNNSINQAEQIGFCDSLKSSHNSIVCLANLQAASGNRSICGRIRGYEAMHACQNLVAYATGDLSACGGPNPYYYEQCIMNMAVIKKNVSLCLMLDTGGPEIAYSWCFDHYARELKDPTVCGMLKKEENRDSCRKNAAGT